MSLLTCKGSHFPKCIILQAVFWYLRNSLSYRDIEELMEERGIEVDHSAINRWVIKYTPLLETEVGKREKTVGTSWRLDETYIKVKGRWHYLYRAVDKENNTIDFLLTKKRDQKSAKMDCLKKSTLIKAAPTFQQSRLLTTNTAPILRSGK